MRKNIFFIFFLLVLVCFLPQNKVCAEIVSNDSKTGLFSEKHKQIWYSTGGGNPVRSGGINKIDGVCCQTEEDTEKLENHLRLSGYILVNTDEKEISEKEYNLLCNGDYTPPYSHCFDAENEYYWTMCKVYMYSESYKDAISQLEDTGDVDMITRNELITSTVVVNYSEWYERGRVGKVVNEFNDNIPSWNGNGGFLCILSSIDAEITMEYYYDHTLNVFYVTADKPLLIKMRSGAHLIKSINSQQIDENESSLVHSNNIYIYEEYTEKNPYILDIGETVEKYDIPSVDISDKPDCSWNGGAFVPVENIPEESVIVEDESIYVSENKKDNTLIWRIIFISVMSVSVLTLVIIFKVIRKKNSRF